GDEAGCQGERGQRPRVAPAQQPQGVVLLGGEAVPAEQVVFQGPQPVVGPPEVEEGLLLRRIEATSASGRRGRGAHGEHLICWNKICPNNCLQDESLPRLCGCPAPCEPAPCSAALAGLESRGPEYHLFPGPTPLEPGIGRQ